MRFSPVRCTGFVRRLALAVALVQLAAACGDDGAGNNDAATVADANNPADALCVPPGAPPGIVYLNKQAGTYTMGTVDDASQNVSQILDMERTFAAYTGAIWNELVSCFSAGVSMFNVSVVETDPGDVDHTEMVFTDTPPSAWPGANIAAVSALECAGIARPIAFVFAGVFGSGVEDLCNTALQQWAVASASLDHAYECKDYMTFLQGCGDKSFLDDDVRCGEFEERDCQCGGATQNSYQTLLAKYGPACQ